MMRARWWDAGEMVFVVDVLAATVEHVEVKRLAPWLCEEGEVLVAGGYGLEFDADLGPSPMSGVYETESEAMRALASHLCWLADLMDKVVH